MNNMNMSENNLLPSFRDSVFRNCADILQDYSEVVIDTILGPGIFSSLPIVSTVTAICKAGLNIKERNYLRQTLAFIKGFHSGTIAQQKLDDYRNTLISDRKRAEKELGRVMVILDSTIEQEQSEVLGRFYKAYVWGNYDWDTFRQLSSANQRLFFNDYEVLNFIELRYVNSDEVNAMQRCSIERLQALGLVIAEGEIKMTCGMSELKKYWYYLSRLGILFYFYSQEGNMEKKLTFKE